MEGFLRCGQSLDPRFASATTQSELINDIWLEADHFGNYLGPCAEFCGNKQAWMRFQVIDNPPTNLPLGWAISL
jgi:hypothetical protein